MVLAERNLPLSAAFAAWIGLFCAAASRAEDIAIPGVEEGSDVMRVLALAFGGAAEGRLVLVPPHSGAGRAVSDVIADRAVFARINRDLLPHERAAGLAETPIFDLPIVVIGHPDLPRHDLTLAELRQILAGDRQNWREFGLPEAPIRLVMHGEIGAHLAVHPAVRKAEVARARDVDPLVEGVPGAIGLTTAQIFVGAGRRVLSIEGRMPDDPAYPLRARIRLVYKPMRLNPGAAAFLDFLAGERASRLIGAQGARSFPR